MSDFFVTVGGERGETFKSVLGTNRVAVRSPVPTRVQIDPLGGVRNAYLLDLEALTETQRHHLVEHIVQRFGLPRRRVMEDLDRDGVPVLAEDCSVEILRIQKWL